MPYTRPYAGGFVDYPSTTTPINSTALNTMDVGIKTANDQFQSVTTAQRSALSPTVGQCVWDSDLKQLMVYMNASGGNAWQPIGNRIVCTSTTRPSSPFHGQVVYETDTKKELTYNGSAWVQTNSSATTSGVTGVSNLIVPPMCAIHRTTAQSVSGEQKVQHDTSYIDTDGMATTGTNAKITINTAGVYLVTAELYWEAWAGNAYRGFSVWKNGGTTTRLIESMLYPGNGLTAMSQSRLVTFTAGEYIEQYAFQDSGVARNLYSANTVPAGLLSAIWVGRTS